MLSSTSSSRTGVASSSPSGGEKNVMRKTTCQFSTGISTSQHRAKKKKKKEETLNCSEKRGETIQTRSSFVVRATKSDERGSSAGEYFTSNKNNTYTLSSHSRKKDKNNNLVAHAFDATMDENKEDNNSEIKKIVKPRFGMAIDPEVLPRNDETDKLIMKLFIPAVLNFLIIPLVGIVDVFWVGRMGDAVALAAQGAANQVFQSAFWIISFIPSVVAPMVARAAAGGDKAELQNKIGEGIFCAFIVGLFGMTVMGCLRNPALGLVGLDPVSATGIQAAPYIGIRALTFIPAIVSTVGFAAFRGTLDVTTPMKITLASQLMNVILDPIFIFGFGYHHTNRG